MQVQIGPPRKSKVGLVFVLVTLAALAVGALVLLVFLLYRPMAREVALAEARKRGVELDCDTIDTSIGEVVLQGCRFSLIGVRGVRGTLEKAVVTLDGTNPTSIEAEGIDVAVSGAGPDLAIAVSEWAAVHPQAFRIPVTAQRAKLAVSASEGGKPWLDVDSATVVTRADGGEVEAEAAKLADVSIGRVGARWQAVGDTKTGSVRLGLGESDLDKAPLRLEVSHAEKPAAKIVLLPTAAEKLALPLGVALPVDGVEISGEANLTFEGATGAGPIRGALAITAKGFVPPHPPELAGIVFGDATRFESKIEVDAARAHARLVDSSVSAGAFKLKGGGDLRRGDGFSTIDLTLKGSIACTDVARSAAAARLGAVLGGIVGGLARQAVQGSVGVTVRIQADTRDLASAKLDRKIGVGCGIKSFGIQIPSEFPAIPPLPSGLPAIPKDFPFPFPAPPKPSG